MEQNAFITCSCRFLRSNTLEQSELKLEKNIWNLETYRKSLKRYVNICDFWLTLTGTIWFIGTGFCFLRIWTCCISGIIFNHISYWNFTWVSFNPSYIVCGCLFVSIGTKLKTFELSIRKLTWNQKTIYYILQQKSFSF